MCLEKSGLVTVCTRVAAVRPPPEPPSHTPDHIYVYIITVCGL